MNILSTNKQISYKPTFTSVKAFKTKFNKKPINKLPNIKGCVQESLTEIKNILPVAFAGTKCEGAIMLPDFWKSVNIKNLAQTFRIKSTGLSTNKDGYADSFLKTKSTKPISTSFVHDCAVMYLYNDKTKTHALYHAAPRTKIKKLDFMIKTLMPEGFTQGCIIPGDFVFYKEQKANLTNMFELMKKHNPNAVINVFWEPTRFPEIVGYKGQVFQIPNKKVREQMNKGIFDVTDFGQASFKIEDIGAFNTFDDIFGKCRCHKDLIDLKEQFLKAKYPKTMLSILFEQIRKMKNAIILVNETKNLKELEDLRAKLNDNNLKTLFLKRKEEMLIQKLGKIKNEEDLIQFYQNARTDFIRMNKLLHIFHQKMKEIV